MKKSLFFASLLACFLLVGCAKGESNDSTKDSSSASEVVVAKTELTVDALGLVSQKYQDGTKEIGGITFNFEELGNYGNGIQMRTKEGKSSKITNTNAFAGVKEVKIVLHEGKTGFANEGALKITAGDEAGAATEELLLNTEKDVAEYTLTFTKAYKYVTIQHNMKFSLYVDSFTFGA